MYIKNFERVNNFLVGQSPDCGDYLKVSGRNPVRVIQ